MPPPILKSTKGKKRNGPRPTARFVSPQESPSSSLSPQVAIEPCSPTRPEKRTISSSRKNQGHVVSAGSKKKRPVIVRRKSSQSSGDIGEKTLDKSSVSTPWALSLRYCSNGSRVPSMLQSMASVSNIVPRQYWDTHYNIALNPCLKRVYITY